MLLLEESFSILGKLAEFWHFTGFYNVDYTNVIMLCVGLFFIYLAIKHNFEPMLLVPIGFGILIGNIPFQAGNEIGIYEEGSVLNILYQGVRQGWYPPLIFLGIGAMTDFSSLPDDAAEVVEANPLQRLVLTIHRHLGTELSLSGRPDGHLLVVEIGAQPHGCYRGECL